MDTMGNLVAPDFLLLLVFSSLFFFFFLRYRTVSISGLDSIQTR